MHRIHAAVATTTKPTMRIRIIEDENDVCNFYNSKTYNRRRSYRKSRTAMWRRPIDFIVMLLSLLLLSPEDKQFNSWRQQRYRTSSVAFAFLPPIKSRGRNAAGKIKLSRSSSRSSSLIRELSDATTSPLFSNRIQKPTPTKFSVPIQSNSRSQSHVLHRKPIGKQFNSRSPFSSRRSSSLSAMSSPTALHMVLTTPESIIEQASTVNLLDDLINESVRTSARRPIMMQFDPSSGWIWRRWKGTVFAETWISCARNVLFATAVFLIHRKYPTIFSTYLSGFNTLWGQLLSVTTFTLTFFVNQSYALWRKCMELSRRLQGRLHDVNMNMCSHAQRVVPSDPNEKATYTVPARQILELMSRYVRLFNLFTYASFTRSHRPLLTPRGLRRLVERGLITAQEREVLVDAVIPPTQRHSVVLMWMIRLFVEGRASGHIQGGYGFESETMHKFHIIRSQYGAIGDELQGRMPLAYTHIVQVLVDCILWMFPIMAFSIGMSPLLVFFGTGLLTVSYQGLFDLAKQFLDPYDNESYGRGDDPLCVDTLIAETNAGSIRWLYGFEELPFSAQRLNEGELYEYLLPVRGYSVEELDEMERERIEREQQLEEQRKREDEEAAAAAEAERLKKELEEDEQIDVDQGDEDIKTSEDDVSVETDTSEKNATVLELVENEDTQVSELPVANGDAIDDYSNILGVMTFSKVENDIDDSNTTNSDLLVNGDDKKETRPVHTVTTLATDGSPISSFKPSEAFKSGLNEPVPSGMQTSNYLATLRSQNERIKSLLADTDIEKSDSVEEEDLSESDLFDQIISDDQELKASQLVSDGEQIVEAIDDVKIKNLTSEDFEVRLKEIEDDTENEMKEAIEILRVGPGEKYYVVTERTEKSQTDKQTQLDGISEDLAALSEETPEIIDKNGLSDSQNVIGSEVSEKESAANENQGEIDNSDLDRAFENQTISDHDENGKEDIDDAPMTLEDYNEQVKEITEKLEEELRETEAILLSKPGTDPVGWDYDDEDLAPMSNETSTDEGEDDQEILNLNRTATEEIDHVAIKVDDNSVDGDSDNGNITPNVAKNDEGTMEVVEDKEANAMSINGVNEINGVSFNGELPIEMRDSNNITDALVDESTIESIEIDENGENGGKKLVEPIFLEEQGNGNLYGEDEDDVRI